LTEGNRHSTEEWQKGRFEMKKNTNMLERLRHYRLMVSYAARQKQEETAGKTGKRK